MIVVVFQMVYSGCALSPNYSILLLNTSYITCSCGQPTHISMHNRVVLDNIHNRLVMTHLHLNDGQRSLRNLGLGPSGLSPLSGHVDNVGHCDLSAPARKLQIPLKQVFGKMLIIVRITCFGIFWIFYLCFFFFGQNLAYP